MTDYCTAAQVKGAGRLNITDTTYDTQLGEIITAASRWIDRYCTDNITNAFAAAAPAVARYYGADAIDGAVILLDAPLLSVTSITNGEGTTVTSQQYRLIPRNGRHYTMIRMLDGGPGWAAGGEQEVTVTGVWGLATSCPEPVNEACAMLAGWMLKRWQMALADATANQELGQVIYGEAMPKQVAELLRPYVVRRLW